MTDFRSIKVTKGIKTLEIDNPTGYPLIGMGAQGAVFKLSEERCVKIYSNPLQASMELEALEAGQHLPFFPRLFENGQNYIVMEYFNAPTLKEYLRNCTFIPESIARKLLYVLGEMKKAQFTMVDAPLRHIFVLENEELKLIDHVNAFKRVHPVPLKLLRDLNMMLLKESFLSLVNKLEPETYEMWQSYFNENKMDYRNIPVDPGGNGEGVKVDSAISQTLIGAGHQGAVYRVSENQCVKIYPKTQHCEQEKEVLLSHQELSFIPEVYETGDNYVVMEYLSGPDLNSFLKKQSTLPQIVTKLLLEILTSQKQAGFKQIDAPLRHVFVTNSGFKMVDHVYSFSRIQERPLELFQNLHERGFLDAFLEQVKVLDPATHAEWTKTPIPLTDEEAQLEITNIDTEPLGKRDQKRQKGHNHKKGHDRKQNQDHKKGHDRKKGKDNEKERDHRKGHDRDKEHGGKRGNNDKKNRDRNKKHGNKKENGRKKGSGKK
jgi:RIO-like serine/threonine protein kinase